METLGSYNILLKRDKNKIIAVDTNRQISATARCHPDDVFDLEFGVQLATSRLMAKLNRTARVGDLVRISNSKMAFTTATKWFEKYSTVLNHVDIARYRYGQIPNNGVCGEVVFIGYHLFSFDLALVRTECGNYLVALGGLEVIKRGEIKDNETH